jgi:hypothetical protein
MRFKYDTKVISMMIQLDYAGGRVGTLEQECDKQEAQHQET